MASGGTSSSRSERGLALSCTKLETWWHRTGRASTELLVPRFENHTNHSIGLIVYFLMGNVPDFNPEDNVYLQQKSLNTDMY